MRNLETYLKTLIFVQNIFLFEMAGLESSVALGTQDTVTDVVDFPRFFDQLPFILSGFDVRIWRMSEDAFWPESAFAN